MAARGMDLTPATPLMAAVADLEPQRLAAVIQRMPRAQLGRANLGGITALHGRLGNVLACAALLAAGAGANTKDWLGWTPLHLATGLNYNQAIAAALLIDHGAGVNARDRLYPALRGGRACAAQGGAVVAEAWGRSARGELRRRMQPDGHGRLAQRFGPNFGGGWRAGGAKGV